MEEKAGPAHRGVLGPASRRITLATLDQVCSGGSNMLIVFAAARVMDIDAFGAFSLAFVTVTFGVALQREVLGLPLLTRPHGRRAESDHLAVGRSLWVGVLGGMVLGAFVVVLGALTEQLGICLLLAIGAPAAIAQDTLRFVAAARTRQGVALVSDLLWVAVTIGAFALTFTGPLSPLLLPALWSAGSVVALAGAWVLLDRPTPVVRRAWTTVARDPQRRRLAAYGLVTTGNGLVVANGIAAFATPSVLGTVNAARSLFSPLNVLHALFVFALGPETLRLSGRGRLRLMFLAGACAATLSVAWGVVLLVTPLGSLLLGPTWSAVASLVPIFMVESASVGLWNACTAALRITGLAKIALRMRLAFSLSQVVLVLSVAIVVGSARSLAIALAASAAVNAALCVVTASGRRGLG